MTKRADCEKLMSLARLELDSNNALVAVDLCRISSVQSICPIMIVAALSGPAPAQTSIPVQFESGSDSATLSGSIIGDEYVDYVLEARGGQMMNVGLSVEGTNGSGTVYFNILPPGSDGEAIYNGSINGNDAFVELPSNCEYTIRVYHMGNDRDTGKTSGFVVGVGIK